MKVIISQHIIYINDYQNVYRIYKNFLKDNLETFGVLNFSNNSEIKFRR